MVDRTGKIQSVSRGGGSTTNTLTSFLAKNLPFLRKGIAPTVLQKTSDRVSEELLKPRSGCVLEALSFLIGDLYNKFEQNNRQFNLESTSTDETMNSLLDLLSFAKILKGLNSLEPIMARLTTRDQAKGSLVIEDFLTAACKFEEDKNREEQEETGGMGSFELLPQHTKNEISRLKVALEKELSKTAKMDFDTIKKSLLKSGTEYGEDPLDVIKQYKGKGSRTKLDKAAEWLAKLTPEQYQELYGKKKPVGTEEESLEVLKEDDPADEYEEEVADFEKASEEFKEK